MCVEFVRLYKLDFQSASYMYRPTRYEKILKSVALAVFFFKKTERRVNTSHHFSITSSTLTRPSASPIPRLEPSHLSIAKNPDSKH
jgi:hypothetical protein